ncbi:MAG TPA: winged helix DNA-binding domain-containing protein, partial [Leptolinea sp.]
MTDIANIRLVNQQITSTKFKTVKDLVSWMGAMQAQDYAMVKWAIGVRLPDSTDLSVETALNNAEILRTHILRPTWHLVSADDIYWLQALTAPRIKTKLKSRDTQLGLSPSVFAKSNLLLEKALSGGKQLTREEIINEFEKASIVTGGPDVSHILLQAELDGIVCSGAMKGGKQTFALLQERVPKTNNFTNDEALANLAKKYFSSHSPATIQDFIWWSGLSSSSAKKGLDMVKSDFFSETINSQTYWYSNSLSIPEPSQNPVHLLPAFD